MGKNTARTDRKRVFMRYNIDMVSIAI